MNRFLLFIFCSLLVQLLHSQQFGEASNTDKTWIVTKALKANGAVKAISKQYFDKIGKATQGQSRNMTTGQILASEPVNDAYGRPAVSPLSAPVGSTNFGYKENFITDATGKKYDYTNFDEAKTDNPDPLGAQSGTLGWYYSSNNNIEERVPVTSYPYSRSDFYKDGTGNVKRSTGVGEAYKMGTGRDVSSYITPVQNELDHYLQIRNKYFTETELGAMPASLAGQAFQSIAKDVNGKEIITITDKDGKTLVSAVPGNELSVNNSVQVWGQDLKYALDFTVNFQGEANGITFFNNNGGVTDGHIFIYKKNSSSGLYQLSYDGSSNQSSLLASPGEYRLEADSLFVVTRYESPVEDFYATLNKNLKSKAYYFKTFSSSTVTVTGAGYILYDMATEQPITGFTGSATLPKGYYKLVNNGTDLLTLTYTNSYSDISYTFYNQLGQAVAAIDPEGVSKLIQDPNAYTTKTNIPFISTNEYNLRGQLVAATSADGARAEFIYRRDGKLRFSQNAKQKTRGWFSYTNYDRWGRAIESGEYHPAASGDVDFAGLNTNRAIQEDVSAAGGLTLGTKADWTRTRYDAEDNSHGQAGYTQTFVRGGVSTTEGPASKTWHSYDEQGRSVWTIKVIKGMDGGADKYFTEDYFYDSEGKVVKSVFQKNTAAETFVQYYEYDADERLSKAYTNTTDDAGTKILQAKYDYFLHGPVKRLEIGGNLQGIDYTYTLDGKLKAINHSRKELDPGQDGVSGATHANFLPDAFGEVLEYYDNDYTSNTAINGTAEAVLADLQVSSYIPQTTVYRATNSITFLPGFDSGTGSFSTELGVPASGGGTVSVTNIGIAVTDTDAPAQYGGQIRAMSWFSKKPPMAGVPETPAMYAYKYDDKYRFNTATWGGISNNAFTAQPGVNNETVTGYDKHGNLLNLSRTNQAGNTVDNFAYNYQQTPKPTNRLASILQQTTNQTYASYQYDELGQLTGEVPGAAYGSAPAKYMAYNVAGLVTAVFSDADTIHPLVRYAYDEAGARIKKISYNSSGAVIKTTYYIGDIIYEQQGGQALAQTEVPVSAGGRIGIYFRQSNAYRYEMQDHLGNVRAVLLKTSTGTTDYVVFRDYYPFGMEIAGRSYTDADGYRYGYQGKYAEKDPETGWNAFELRMYDSRIGRWLSIDPAGEFLSPYMAMGNDPINLADPTGGFTDGDPIYQEKVPLPEVVVVGHVSAFKAFFRDMGKDFSREMRHAGEDIKYYAGKGWDQAKEFYDLGLKPGMDWINQYFNPTTKIAEIGFGKSYASNFTEPISRVQPVTDLAIMVVPVGKSARLLEAVVMENGTHVLASTAVKGGYSEASSAVRSALADRTGKRGFSEVGYQFQKHFGRGGNWGGAISEGAKLNPATFNQAGYSTFKEIWRAPGSFQKVGGFLEKRLSDGRGMRLQENWQFKGFLE
ncbi:MAG: RHS repeat-associated core domain-containing protein [Niabella sp.]|nr:RHS repeat-associated core domain-containing protein [Niabella sp.]